MRLIVARCEVRYSGRLSTVLPEALRLLMLKSDGSVMVHADTGGYKPQNWMTPPTVIEEEPGLLVVRKKGGEDRIEIRIAEVLSDVTHDMGEAAALEKEGVERELQELLADTPPKGRGSSGASGPRTSASGPDVPQRPGRIRTVEIRRIGTIDAVEELTRYSSASVKNRAFTAVVGLAAQAIKPQARALGRVARDPCVEVVSPCSRASAGPT